ncbi:lysoplasmalogenase [Yeosuana sp.]|uniref:lysoplasmalogenase n=1 Tax=Yeosuana sp. TaxID=2529388 RepID=UPI004054FB50
MNKIKITFFVFLLASILEIVGIIFTIPILVYIFKPLIVFSLIFLYVFSLPKRLKWYVMALELCFFGDVFLMFPGKMFFIFGLVSFLIAHFLFIKIVVNSIKKTNVLKVVYSVIPFLTALSLLIFILKDSLHEMFWPVLIYGLTISTFGSVSLINHLETKSKKSLFMLIGAVIFMVSDSVLAINKFYEASHLFEIIVMSTYILAQYLIFRSMVLTEKYNLLNENEINT